MQRAIFVKNKIVVPSNSEVIVKIKKIRYKPLNLFKDRDFLFDLEAGEDGTLVYAYIVDYNMIMVQVKNDMAEFLMI